MKTVRELIGCDILRSLMRIYPVLQGTFYETPGVKRLQNYIWTILKTEVKIWGSYMNVSETYIKQNVLWGRRILWPDGADENRVLSIAFDSWIYELSRIDGILLTTVNASIRMRVWFMSDRVYMSFCFDWRALANLRCLYKIDNLRLPRYKIDWRENSGINQSSLTCSG